MASALWNGYAAHRRTLEPLQPTEKACDRFLVPDTAALLHADIAGERVQSRNLQAMMTVLFSSIHDFTKLSEPIKPAETGSFVNAGPQDMEPVIGDAIRV